MIGKASKTVSAALLASALALPTVSSPALAGGGEAFVGGLIGSAVGTMISNAARNNQRRGNYRKSNRSQRSTRSTRSSRAAVTSAQRTENMNLQKALNLLGYNVGKADGAFGKKTRTGIRQFQMARGFAPSGKLTAYEKQILLSVPFQIEQALYSKGFAVGAVDGKIDQQTAIAVSQFQGQLGQMPTGTLNASQAQKLLGKLGQPNMMVQQQGAMPQQNHMQQSTMLQATAPMQPQQQPVQMQNASLSNSIAPKAATAAALAAFPAIKAASFTKGKVKNDNAVAIIIGNRDYKNKDIPSVEYATRDAEAMKYTFINTLGINEDNIIELNNATLAQMVDTFGDTSPDGSALWSFIDPDGQSDVYVYYAGHGIPSLSNKGGAAEAYLAPTDIMSTSSTQSSYALSKLYANLEALPTRSVTVFLDACFSGAAGDGKMIIEAASPIVIPAYAPEKTGSLNIFAAAQADQIASWDKKNGHGIFTKHLVSGLSGKADLDDDSKVSTGELGAYLKKSVHRSARRNWRRDQTPTFKGDEQVVLVNY